MPVPLSPQQSNIASPPPTKTSGSQKGKPATAPQQHPMPTPAPVSTVKSKKDSSKTSTSSTMPANAELKDKSQDAAKKVARRSSKPIINWFQRKLAGTVRARRASETQRYNSLPTRSGKDSKHRRSSVPVPPPLTIQSRTRSITAVSRQNRSHSHISGSRRGTLSLNETVDDTDNTSYASASEDDLASSVARDSAYSPASYLEADEDASVRPLPPSSPPSPSPSRSSSSYLSHSRTFRSMTASTKPTTLLSVDLTGGMAHIAQAPPTPTTPGHRIPPHIRTHSSGPSAGSITFSAIPPPSPTSASRPSSGYSGAVGSRGATLTAPLYTSHHPRNNPRPSSPPPDDASVLTLASSAFGMPGARFGAAAVALSGRGSIADDSVSQWSHAAGLTDSTSHFMMGDLDEGMEEERYRDMYHDVDASVRALRPRSSRRGSWDSAVSGWSANVGVSAPSPGGIKTKGLWRSGSFRTNGLSTENEEAVEDGFVGTNADGDKETEGSETQAHDTASQSSKTQEGGDTATTGDVSEITEDAKTPPAVGTRDASSTMTLPGSKAAIPDDLASTWTLPGSKAMSEVTSPGTTPSSVAHSGTSTPTKGEPISGEADVAAGAGDSDNVDTNRFSAQLSPTGSEAHTVYHSLPSTPAS
ncbi:hypothetical protein PYCCODRAFT_1395594 [Trametes coccinea BRFM310]|uniref:Uncharacterized protein n=1 Tax=Trametes coccinea (strain BRFM310) TaxID=1353009 RepID=A0A1Y2IDE8_TRAC3|nr:hypothetical protein PYCCODRAFT_1395594 [Trametes coccinea BRFM310]